MTGPHTTQSTGYLLDNCVHFGRMLRAVGIPVTGSHMADFTAALGLLDLTRREDVRAAGRALFVTCRDQLARFDAVFDLFWQPPGRMTYPDPARLMPEFPAQAQVKSHRAVAHAAAASELVPQWETTETYSAAERLRRTDFARLSDAELAQVRQMIATLAWEPPARKLRRARRVARGPRLDLRATLRASLASGGEPLRLWYRQRPREPRPIVVLCDVSGSMERYSRVLLQFVYALGRRWERVEAFAFSTRLTPLGRALRARGMDAALAEAVRHIHDWGGGTRIGEALHQFNRTWSKRVLSHGAIVLLISDGWDRGDVGLLARETARLQRTCHQLIWLNPRLGSAGYEPQVRGIRAVLPHIDAFLPVQNLEHLEQLAAILESTRRGPAPITLPRHAWQPGTRPPRPHAAQPQESSHE